MSIATRLTAAFALICSTTAIADNVRGTWSSVGNWPLIAAHAVLTPDGRVLTYGTDGNGKQTGFFIYDVWDPASGLGGGHVTLPNITNTDIFCSSQLVLSQSGSIFVAGGDNYVNGATTNTGNNNTNVFNPTDNSLNRGNNLNRARWYSTATTLVNGEVYIQGGNGGGDRPEIRDSNGLFRVLSGVDTNGLSATFPRNFLAPDGRVFGFDTGGRMYYVNPASTGTIAMAGQLPGATNWTSSAVMFRPGRILQMGGASSAALVIDINGAAPAVTATQSMSSQRQWVTATVLADGRVLGTGGSQVDNQLTGVNNIAEIWNPATGQWTQGASGARARLYHSNALLLPDATVLIAGGGAPGPLVNLNAEIYYPPYLYDATGAFAPRPTITSVPAFLEPGQLFQVTYANASAIGRVSLVKTGSVTHSFNMDQRFLDLPFNASGAELAVQAPSRAGDLPPGYYMLFVLNTQGVPSTAKILRVSVAGSGPPPDPDLTAVIGGGGGGPFELACQNGEALVGVVGSAGTYVNQVGPQCVAVDQNGRWIGAPISRGITGLQNGTTYTKTCPVNFAVSGYRGRSSAYVDQLDFQCRALTSTGKVTGIAQYLGAVGSATGTAQGPYSCSSDNPVYALHGRSGSWMDSFGMRCRQVAVTTVNAPPSATNPGSQSGNVGDVVDLQIAATDADGDALTFNATGLPAGLSISASGQITGTLTEGGSHTIVVTVSDVNHAVNVTFSWTVTTPPPFVLNPLPLAQPATADSLVSYTASVVGGSNVRFKWFFDDGTPQTEYSSSASITHAFTVPGVYYVTVTAVDDAGFEQMETVTQVIHLPMTANRPTASTNIAFEPRGSGRVWIVNQDNDSVSVFDAVSNAKVAEITVGASPRAIAIAPDGRIWITNKAAATISVINPSTLTVAQTITLPFASQPYGIAFAPTGGFGYVALEGSGRVLKLDASSGAQAASVSVGANPRHLAVNSDGSSLYVSRFITPPLPGEQTAIVPTDAEHGGEVILVSTNTMTVQQSIVLRTSDKPDFETQGGGVPNYLGAPAISPDGLSAWVPSKQDNVQRGTLRNGSNLSFQNTVRAIASRIALDNGAEDYDARVDLDNAGLASVAAFDPYGVYMFVALETSREVAVVDAHGRWEIFRFNVGRAPQGLAVSPDGARLYVNNFMDRTVGVFDLTRLMRDGESNVPAIATLQAVASERLSATVLKGKQFFYDARDTRLARDAYISCASCHNDGGHDGRTWDLTGMGEGLRNTASLRGRAGAQGFLHWSANFNEVQDFEAQIRTLAGGTGLMTDAQFNTGTRSQPLGDPKAGVNADLDALAAYVASLNTFANSPLRNADGSLTADAVAGRQVFRDANCAQCHSGAAFTESGSATLRDVGTIKPSSGKRLNGLLTGIDTPTLRDVWATAPYLHDGSAATLVDAVSAHTNVSLTSSQLASVAAYIAQIGAQETTAPVPNAAPTITNPGNRTGKQGTAVTLAITASDPNGDALTFSATGLPPGLSINTSTGTISGTPTTVGTSNVTVTVRDATLSASASFTWTVTSSDTSVPSTPNNLSLSLSAGDPRLTWSASSDNVKVTGYAIYRSTNGTLGPEVARVTTTNWTDTTAQEGVTYTYAVKAFDAAGNFSARSSLRSILAYQIPSTPGSLKAALSGGKPRLTWNASTDNTAVVGYIIYRSTNGSLGPEIARTSSIAYTDTSARSGRNYTYAIKAYDAAGYTSNRSSLVTIRSQ